MQVRFRVPRSSDLRTRRADGACPCRVLRRIRVHQEDFPEESQHPVASCLGNINLWVRLSGREASRGSGLSIRRHAVLWEGLRTGLRGKSILLLLCVMIMLTFYRSSATH